MEEGLSEGSVRVGVLEVSRQDRTQAWLRSPHTGDFFIPTRLCQNRALPGDTVAVRLLPRALWQVQLSDPWYARAETNVMF